MFIFSTISIFISYNPVYYHTTTENIQFGTLGDVESLAQPAERKDGRHLHLKKYYLTLLRKNAQLAFQNPMCIIE